MISGSGFSRKQVINTAKWLTIFVFGLFLIFVSATELKVLMSPGPLSMKHSSLSQCNSCHTKFADNYHWWISAAFSAANPVSDSNKCIACHSIKDAQLSAHNMSKTSLAQITNRLRTSKETDPNSYFSLSKFLSPMNNSKDNEIFCATCHQEHRSQNDDLKTISDKQCQSCHVKQFSNFQHGHPPFESYPLKLRNVIQFDHKSHFDKHFAEAAKEKQEPGQNERAAPQKCTYCHKESSDATAMTLKSFDQTCRACHLKQILGKDKAVGPKGVAFLSLPGLDLNTLRDKKVDIGEWPENSEAEPSAMLLRLLASKEEYRSFLKIIRNLDLMDLSEASDAQISAVEQFVWSLKKMVFDLLWSAKTNLGKLTASGFKSPLRPELLSGLTANISRDVLVGAQQEWLPNLRKEVLELRSANPNSTRQQPQKTRKNREKSRTPKSAQVAKAAIRNSGNGRWRVNPFGKLVKGDEQDGNAKSRDNLSPTEDVTPDNSASTEDNRNPASDDSDIDAVEQWGSTGGWYRKDYTIYYKPAEHADRFMRTWLQLTGSSSTTPDNNFTSEIFKKLSNPETPGRCAKCHVIDRSDFTETDKKATKSNRWKFSSRNEKKSRLTTFDHKPHLILMDDKGCFTCHTLKKSVQSGTPDLKSKNVIAESNFNHIEKRICEQCHTSELARNDCLLCHNYHSTTIQRKNLSDNLPRKN